MQAAKISAVLKPLGYSLLLLLGLAARAMSLPAVESVPVMKLTLDSGNFYYSRWQNKMSLELRLLYRQTLTLAYENIGRQIIKDKLAAHSWAVIFSYSALMGVNERATESGGAVGDVVLPGAKGISCSLEKLGAKVIIVGNNDRGYNLSQLATMHLIEDNLKHNGVCFSSVMVPNTSDATNKNPLFTAVSSGDYENIFMTGKLPALKVVAYFGTMIEDFPNFKANTVLNLPLNSDAFNGFGDNYYLLPRL